MSLMWYFLTASLRGEHIRLSDWDDYLIWDLDLVGAYNPKARYIFLSAEFFNRDLKWWWSHLWKMNSPSKSKLFGWKMLEK